MLSQMEAAGSLAVCMSPICMSAYWTLIYYKVLTGTKPVLWQVQPLLPAKVHQKALAKAHMMWCSQPLGALWPGPTQPLDSRAQGRTTCVTVT